MITNICQIMMKWSLESKDYELVHQLYTEWGIGIPVKYTYMFPLKRSFNSIDSFINNNEVRYASDKYLENIMYLFRKSKYIRLDEWEGLYGYRFCI